MRTTVLKFTQNNNNDNFMVENDDTVAPTISPAYLTPPTVIEEGEGHGHDMVSSFTSHQSSF